MVLELYGVCLHILGLSLEQSCILLLVLFGLSLVLWGSLRSFLIDGILHLKQADTLLEVFLLEHILAVFLVLVNKHMHSHEEFPCYEPIFWVFWSFKTEICTQFFLQL